MSVCAYVGVCVCVGMTTKWSTTHRTLYAPVCRAAWGLWQSSTTTEVGRTHLVRVSTLSFCFLFFFFEFPSWLVVVATVSFNNHCWGTRGTHATRDKCPCPALLLLLFCSPLDLNLPWTCVCVWLAFSIYLYLCSLTFAQFALTT